MNVYRIINKDCLYSSGTSKVKFGKDGKKWFHIRHVNYHINMLKKSYPNEYQKYIDEKCEIENIQYKIDKVIMTKVV